VRTRAEATLGVDQVQPLLDPLQPPVESINPHLYARVRLCEAANVATNAGQAKFDRGKAFSNLTDIIREAIHLGV